MVKFSYDVLKSSLRMAVSRIGLTKTRRVAEIQRKKGELLADLARGNEDLARVAAKAIIAAENFLTGMDTVAGMCGQCADMARIIGDQNELVIQIATIIWAESHLDVPELTKVKEQFTAKYGKKEVDESAANSNSLVDAIVVAKILPPVLPEEEITRKVQEVAAERENIASLEEMERSADAEEEEKSKGRVSKKLPSSVAKYLEAKMRKANCKPRSDAMQTIARTLGSPISPDDDLLELKKKLDRIVSPQREASPAPPAAPADDLEAMRQRFSKLI